MFRAAIAVTRIAALALIVSLAGSVSAQGDPPRAQEVPPELMPPASAVLLFELGARGVQMYACEAKPEDATAFAWTFKGPEAELLNVRGEVVGDHFGGPTWQGLDGSAVIAAVVARADSPDPAAIPWLLLEAQDHDGSGVLTTVTHIQRLDTTGGAAPSEGCHAAHAGETARVPYEATYAFYYPAPLA